MLRKCFFLVVVMVAFFVSSLTAYEYTVGSEQRWGKDMDQWREEGSSSVTNSPVFINKGVRLTCWAVGDKEDEEDYEYAIARAEYLFSVPSRTRSMRIYISYDGNDGQGEDGDGIVGRLWLRRRGSSEGDSFVLRAGEHSETIRLPVDDYLYLISDPRIELRVITEGSQQIDVNYITVDFYSSTYEVRVVTRYYTNYSWRPWYDYGYWYFYHSRELWWDPRLECWVQYTYPNYSYHWGIISGHYSSYLEGYYDGRRDESHRWRWHMRTGGPREIVVWSPHYTEADRVYRISRLSGHSVGVPREKVRSVLAEHKRGSRSFDVQRTIQVDKTRTDLAPSKARDEVRRGTATDLEQRQKVAKDWLEQRRDNSAELQRAAPRSNEGTWRRDTEAGKIRREDARREKDGVRTGTSLDDKRSSSLGREQSSDARRAPALESSMSYEGDVRVKARREAEQPSRSYSAPSRETPVTRSVSVMKQRPEPVRTQPQPQVIERREVDRTPVRTEPRPAPQPQMKERRVVERSPERVSPAPARSSSRDHEEKDKEKQRSASSSGSSARKGRR